MKTSRLLCSLLVATTLTACVETPVPSYKPALDYGAATPYTLDVSETLLINDSHPSALTQEFAQKFSTTLESSLQDWLQRRIRTSGTQGTYSLIIREANFAATPLQTKSGIEGYFTRDQAARWEGRLSVIISADGSGGQHPEVEITVNVQAHSTVPEKSSDDEKSKIYHSLVNQLMTSFNREADKQMQAYMGAYMR